MVPRKPRVGLAIDTALLDRLAVLNRHLIVWIGWAPLIPYILEKYRSAGHLVIWKSWPAVDPKKITNHVSQSSVTNHGFALWAGREPRVGLAIDTALLNRLAVLIWHLIVWIGSRWGLLRFLTIWEKHQTAGHLVIWKPWPAAGHLATAQTFHQVPGSIKKQQLSISLKMCILFAR